MGCLPVRGDNPRALASGLSRVHVDKQWYIVSVDLEHHDMFYDKLVKVVKLKTNPVLSFGLNIFYSN